MNLTVLSGKFTLTDTSLTVSGKPSNEEYVAAFHELRTINDKSNWYIGDLLNELEASGKDLLSTIGDEVGFNYRSLENIKSVCKAIPKDKRIVGVSWSHHIKALGETKKNLVRMTEELEIAKSKNQSVQDMVKNIRAKESHSDKTIIPDVVQNKATQLFGEALNGITTIKRFVNNVGSKLTQGQKNLFLTQFNELVELVEDELS